MLVARVFDDWSEWFDNIFTLYTSAETSEKGGGWTLQYVQTKITMLPQ